LAWRREVAALSMPARCEKDKAWIQSPAPFVSQSRTAFLGSPTSTHTARSTELRIAATTFLYRQARRQYATGGTLSAPREFVMARQQSTCAARHVMSQGAEEPSSGFLRPLGGAGRACLREAEHFGAVVQPKALRTLAELPRFNIAVLETMLAGAARHPRRLALSCTRMRRLQRSTLPHGAAHLHTHSRADRFDERPSACSNHRKRSTRGPCLLAGVLDAAQQPRAKVPPRLSAPLLRSARAISLTHARSERGQGRQGRAGGSGAPQASTRGRTRRARRAARHAPPRPGGAGGT